MCVLAHTHRTLSLSARSPFWAPPVGSASLSLCSWSSTLSSLSSPSTISLAPPVLPPMLATSTPDLRSLSLSLFHFYGFCFLPILDFFHTSFSPKLDLTLHLCSWDCFSLTRTYSSQLLGSSFMVKKDSFF